MASLEKQEEDLSLKTIINPIKFENEEQLEQQTTRLKVTKATLSYKWIKENVLFINYYHLMPLPLGYGLEHKINKEYRPIFSVDFITLSSPENLQHSETIHNLAAHLHTIFIP